MSAGFPLTMNASTPLKSWSPVVVVSRQALARTALRSRALGMLDASRVHVPVSSTIFVHLCRCTQYHHTSIQLHDWLQAFFERQIMYRCLISGLDIISEELHVSWTCWLIVRLFTFRWPISSCFSPLTTSIFHSHAL